MPSLVNDYQHKAQDPKPSTLLLYSSSLAALDDLKECPDATEPFFRTLDSYFFGCGAQLIQLTERVRNGMKDPSILAGKFWCDSLRAESGVIKQEPDLRLYLDLCHAADYAFACGVVLMLL